MTNIFALFRVAPFWFTHDTSPSGNSRRPSGRSLSMHGSPKFWIMLNVLEVLRNHTSSWQLVIFYDGTGVTVICVPPGNVCPQTYLPSDICYPKNISLVISIPPNIFPQWYLLPQKHFPSNICSSKQISLGSHGRRQFFLVWNANIFSKIPND